MTLHLLPNLLSEEQDPHLALPLQVAKIVQKLDFLICESEKGGRRFLSLFLPRDKWEKIPLYTLNEHTLEKEIQDLCRLVVKSKKEGGAISDAGLPSLSDPMHKLTFLLQKEQYPISVYAGPSAPIYALMLSGFSGERFSYHGYLPRKEEELEAYLKKIEKESQNEKSTQIWIEAPYRTQKMVSCCLNTLSSKTWFGVFQNLGSSSQNTYLGTIFQWKQKKKEFSKGPSVFLLQG